MEKSLINKIVTFTDKEIKIYGSVETPYFRGKEIAEILGYKNISDALIKHVRDKNKKSLTEIIDILVIADHDNINNNDLKSIYLTEAGLYELIFSSKMKRAILFKDWVFEEVLPSIRKLGQEKYLKQLEENKELLAIKDKELEDARLGNLKLTNKILNVRPFENNGWIYICTKDEWACKNVFRIGKTIRINDRIKDYRVGTLSDEKIYCVFKHETNHVDLLETILRNILSQFREDPKADQYILHWNILESYIKNICNIFTNQIMTATNNLIKKNEEISEESIIPDKISLDDINDIANKIYKHSKESYYDTIIRIVNQYEGAELLTPKEKVNYLNDDVEFKCEHKKWAVQVRTLTRKSSWSCHKCVTLLKGKKYIEFESENYKLLMLTVNNYEGAEVLTEKQFINVWTDKIKIKCPHMTWDTNVEAVAVIEKWRCEDCKYLKNLDSDETDKPLFIGGHKANDYYKLLQETAAKYPNSQILTPKEKITKGTHRVEIQCPHKTWETKVSSVAKKGHWDCKKCKPPNRKNNK